jgi:hypothetical protein
MFAATGFGYFSFRSFRRRFSSLLSRFGALISLNTKNKGISVINPQVSRATL